MYQTIFLNKKHEETWSKSEIKKDKIGEYHFCPAPST